MANTLFTRFFDKSGTDMNMGATSSTKTVVYYDTAIDVNSLYSGIFFPKVSTGLIESQQIYLLQEVTVPTGKSELRKITGSVTTVSGNSTVTGTYSDYTSLTAGLPIKIGSTDYTITAIYNSTSMDVTPIPLVDQTTDEIYRYDFLNYSSLRSSPNCYKQFLNVYIENPDQTSFFLYDIDYSEDVPYIIKSSSYSIELTDGSADAIDSYSGRIELSSAIVDPIQLNIGLSSLDEDVYEEVLKIDLETQFIGNLASVPLTTIEEILVTISGTSIIDNIYSTSSFYFQGASGSEVFHDKLLTPLAIGITGSDSYIIFAHEDIPGISIGDLSTYRILIKNVDTFASVNLYGETESEDERFKLVLQNFGKKIDFDKEYIFRDSDINEGLPDYKLLNVKRKELLLEGDNIYPYMGSYRSLINVINYFGYYDLQLKEYFLNVDTSSSNYGKFTQLLVPRNDEQRTQVKTAWSMVPSSVHKKTSLFGLFYNLNAVTGAYDEYGMPIVEDSFMFSPEEVLIKLFGLKELLKEQFLPLNARIIDITGEGIYFERYRLDTWADNVNNITINICDKRDFIILPEVSYISDLRRIDSFYSSRFIEQGLSGFVGLTVSNLDPVSTTTISSLYGTSIINYSTFNSTPYDLTGNLVKPVDTTWEFMPPSINDANYNDYARRLSPLPDDTNIPIGAPILLEAVFDISWEEGEFTWQQLSIFDIGVSGPGGPIGDPININMWTWDTVGRGQYIDIRWTVQMAGLTPFNYDSDRRPLSEYVIQTTSGIDRILHAVSLPYEGEYSIGMYLYDITNNFTTQYRRHVVHTRNAEFSAIVRRETPERTWLDFETPLSPDMPDMLSFGEVQISGPRLAEWDEITGPWYYPVHINSSWDDAQISWESLNYSQFKEQTLYEDPLNVSLIEINRENEYVVISGDISIVQTGDSLFFTRNESDLIYENVAISSVSIVSSTTLDILFSTAVTINNYSKLCITTNPIFSSILPSVDFYRYVDSISQINATTIRVKGSMMDINAINSTPLSKYMSCGLFSGTYAIEVLSKIVTGNNTQFNLYDVNKELYYIDGNFAVANADYDVDYAEGRIGINSLTYENANEAEWEEMNTSTWFGLDYHESVSCGFTIPFVTPGGSIRIDEYPSFQFSGNNLISNTKSGLNLAAVELQNSTNEGIQKYDYSVLPAIELYLTGLTGSNIKGSCMAGSTSCVLSEQPSEYPVAVWTGKEWLEIDDISSGTNLVFKTATNYSINNFYLLIPYNYHKQLINSTELQQFYYFIHAKAKNLSSEMLSYVSFANGVESEWISHPKRTYSYPLRNSILFGSTRGEDYLYDKWLYEGGDYPPLNVNIDYISDLHSVQSRVPFMSTLQSPYSFIDTIISTNQQTVPKFTPVMFNYDVSKIPGKSSPKWTVINEESGIIQVISTSINFMWNFTKTGNYTVKLELQDKNGNKSSTTKTSFIVVNKPQPMNLPLSRNMITPTAQTVSTTPSINMI